LSLRGSHFLRTVVSFCYHQGNRDDRLGIRAFLWNKFILHPCAVYQENGSPDYSSFTILLKEKEIFIIGFNVSNF